MILQLQLPSATDVAAWIGALTGIAALLWQAITRRRSAHNVKLSQSQSWFTYPSGELSDDLLCVTARNVGPSAVTVTNWGISLAGSKENLTVLNPLPGSAKLPYRLDSGEEMNLFVEAAAIRRARDDKHVPLTRMRAWVGLATGKRVRARRGVPVSNQ